MDVKTQVVDFLWRLWLKIKELLLSAKFWTMLLAVATAGQLYATGSITAVEFLTAVVTAVSVYMGAKAYEDSNRKA